MVGVQDWGTFALAVRDIFQNSPTTARFCMKYRRSDCLLRVKVTDGRSCVKYRVCSVSELHQVEGLVAAFVSWAANPNPKLGGPELSLEGVLRSTAAASSSPPRARARPQQQNKPQQQRKPQQQQQQQ